MNTLVRLLTTALAAGAAFAAQADAVTDWNLKTADLVTEARMGTPPAVRLTAIVQTAAYRAAVAADGVKGASVEAAVAAAHRACLAKLLPAQQAAIEDAYRKALGAIADGAAKDAGVAAGERAALDVLARRADDPAATAEAYRPFTAAGRYVPTVFPATTKWPQRKPWLMASPAQFRPGPPPSLKSERWSRDYNEIKAIGAARSAVRSAEQTEVARFWETTLPPIYHGVVRSVAEQPGRDLMRNARLFAAVTQAVDDALIAVFDAKYHYGFWRPITAIRNGDLDGNDATELDAAWTPFIGTPMHPEYPCAHCIQAGTIGAILTAEIGAGPQPMLRTVSSAAGGASRSWSSVNAFVQEVGDARVYDGVHFRFSTEVGIDMGRQIGLLAVRRFLGD